MKFNPREDHVIVGGRHPLKYLQGGYGFSAAGECLGRVNEQGEYLEAEVKAPTLAERVETVESDVAPADDREISERRLLEIEAERLGVKFHPNISDEKLAERIKDAQEGDE